MRWLTRPLLVLLALVFLFEAWLWNHLAPIVAWIVARIPLAALKVEARRRDRSGCRPTRRCWSSWCRSSCCCRSSSSGSGCWRTASGSARLPCLAFAKVMSLGVTAFIFELTQAEAHAACLVRAFLRLGDAWLAWAHALVDPVKRRIKLWFRMFSPRRAGRTLKLLLRIRRRMRAPRRDMAQCVPLPASSVSNQCSTSCVAVRREQARVR